jgi:tetratricopeptide (TPR) repeat protein
MRKIFLITVSIFLSTAFVGEVDAQPVEETSPDTYRSAEQHFEKAVEQIRDTRYEAAISELEKVRELVPKTGMAEDAQYWMGQSYYRMGKFDEAISLFEQLIAECPESVIVPATQLMLSRVQNEKKDGVLRIRSDPTSGKSVIVDPETGIEFVKIKTFIGKSDVIGQYSKPDLSPNGKFLLEGLVDLQLIPMDGGDAFDLGIEGYRGALSPDGKKIAFHTGEAIAVVDVSPETGRPSGPIKKLLEGTKRYEMPFGLFP